MSFCVSADITYVEGPLAGIPLPKALSISFPNAASAEVVAARLARHRDARTLRTAAVTGNRYLITGGIDIEAR